MFEHILLGALTFGASFLFVFLKAWQQRNVAFDHYWWIIPTSLLMAAAEVFVIANIASEGYGLPLILLVGFGSGLGALLSAFTHKKILGTKKPPEGFSSGDQVWIR